MLVTGLFADEKKQYIGIAHALTIAKTYTIQNTGISELSLKYGYMFNKYLGIELRRTLQLLKRDEMNHTYSYGLYLKPNYALYKDTNMYGFLGYSKNKLIKNETNFKNKETIQYDFSYGIGIEQMYAKNKYVYIDFLHYIDKSTTRPEGQYTIKINSISMGLKYTFDF